MARSLEGSRCALCRTQASTRDGEHVLPKWFLNRYLPISKGHYTTEVNGVAVLNRDAKPRKHAWPEARVPACESCNRALRNRFEIGDSQAAAQKFFDPPAGTMDAAEAELAGLWLLKTWVLLAHPDAVFTNHQSPESWSHATDLWSWAVDGSEPPPDLCVWVTRQNIDVDAVDTVDVPFKGQARGRGIYERHVVALNGCLWKPADGRLATTARQMWPPTGEPFDFGDLPMLPRNQLRWVSYPFEPPTRLVFEEAGGSNV